MLEKQVADVEREAHALRKCGTYVLINRKLSAKADGVVVKDTECSRTKENLMGLCVSYWGLRLEESVRTFSDELTKESPIPFIWRSTPFLWAIAVNQTVVEHVRSFVPVVLIELCVRATKPNVMTSRCHSADQPEHCSRDV